jgi:nucleoside-diphosphate-sugar epimerase
MQTILGSGGVIGIELAKSLVKYTDKIRLVSRNPKKVNETDELFTADLLNPQQVLAAVASSEIVYITAGLQYRASTWEVQWPLLMQNVINACKNHNAKLVFFDNVYAYGLVKGWMTEDSIYRPVSRKGELRAKIANMLMNETQNGNIQAIIARAADFYGPNTPLSFFSAMVLSYQAKGKTPMWMINPNLKHSLTYTPDAGLATAILGNSPNAYNQVWHLPTDNNALTGRELIELSAKYFGVEPKFKVVSKFILKMIGLFNSVVKESVEMLYQNEYEYLFDSSKFCKEFNFKPTSYSDGMKVAMESYKK